jgi:hypothetical protein
MITARQHSNRILTITIHLLWWHWAIHVWDVEFWTSKSLDVSGKSRRGCQTNVS